MWSEQSKVCQEGVHQISIVKKQKGTVKKALDITHQFTPASNLFFFLVLAPIAANQELVFTSSSYRHFYGGGLKSGEGSAG